MEWKSQEKEFLFALLKSVKKLVAHLSKKSEVRDLHLHLMTITTGDIETMIIEKETIVQDHQNMAANTLNAGAEVLTMDIEKQKVETTLAEAEAMMVIIKGKIMTLPHQKNTDKKEVSPDLIDAPDHQVFNY